MRTPNDAIILFEACRLGLLPRVQRRLSEKERQAIRSGSVFVWDEREAGMRRWTDGKSWSASRVSGSFLTYREMEGKRGGAPPPGTKSTKIPENGRNSAEDGSQQDGEEGPDGYRYKPDGLMKQSFSITTSQGQHLHLISYYSRSHPTAPGLRQPSTDPSLSNIQPQKGMYPETTVNDQSPPVTQGPMAGAPGYALAGYARQATHPQGYAPPYAPPYGYSPTHMSPYSPHPMHYPGHHGLPPLGYPHYGFPINAPPPGAYDQRPLRTPEAERPPPPPMNPVMGSPPSISHPSVPHPYQQNPHPQGVTMKPEPSRDGPGIQIDPALTSTTSAGEVGEQRPTTSGSLSAPAPTSQAPSIEALVNGNHSNNINTERTESSATPATQPVAPAPIDTALPKNPEQQQTGSATELKTQDTLSPSAGAPPQDIPSEKLGFKEDSRALRQLDKAFGMGAN